MEDNNLLFGPKNDKDLGRQYPELRKEPEFATLTVGELLFVWWYANPTSPLVTNNGIDEKRRAIMAYSEAFKKAAHDDERKRKYFSLDFPDRLRMAIDRMRKYNPTVRIRGKQMIEEILKTFEKLVKAKDEDFVKYGDDGKVEINWTGRSNYVTSAKNIADALPSLIKQSEEGFGVIESKDGEATMKAIQRFHSVNEDK